ncbi:precorrin-2 C(20)-methyltransferase [Billgrantia azerbaijanica]|nr:precorrin-2 C(20)-methyltransferase [Halomonas azerbaijanica]
MSRSGTLYGVGLGPGDPDLMSVRADRLIRNARHLAFFRKAGLKGRARCIVDDRLHEDVTEIALEYPVTTEIPFTDPHYNACLADFYETSVERLLGVLRQGHDLVVLCEGDPFFYGSFMHLYTRLRDRVPVTVVPGITGMSGAWTATGCPITWGDDVLTVLMATLPEADLTRRIADSDALVVMKIGRNLPRLRRAVQAAGRLHEAWLVEYATMEQQRVRPLAEAGDQVPYFSTLVIHGNGRRP